MTIENLSDGGVAQLGDIEKLEFDEWKNLHQSNPEKFELYRKQVLQQQISLAPEGSRPRLQGLLFQMEAEAKRARTKLSYNLRLSAIMMDKFEQLRQQLELLTGVGHSFNATLQAASNPTNIISLDDYRTKRKQSD